jgi:hypothetical protein
MNERKITVTQREVYGNIVYYPHDATASAFARIAGTKTLTRGVMDIIERELSYQIVILYGPHPAYTVTPTQAQERST